MSVPASPRSLRRTRLGAAIRNARLAAGLSQEDLAARTGVSRDTVIRIEWGKTGVQVDRLYDFADTCGTTPGALLNAADQGGKSPERIVWRGGRGRMADGVA